MHQFDEQGWWSGAQKIPSPNHNERPEGTAGLVDVLVIHNISLPPGRFGSEHITQLFTNTLDAKEHPFFADIAHLKVAAHFLIRRNGQVIQYVPCDKRAWHAGVSRFDGREGCNDFSIGIELEGTDALPFTDPQYLALESLTRAIQARYPAITQERITGHSDIAPGRKTDPGPCFDWQRYFQRLS
ncbi:1,6-anhydro-N-acetylmuramyl-L-alanine amidase AmpD [Pokkaliibacter sp. CJK22405]|uniref:1,6-anhydro-N-acetylmuramyl-L-alanine amidase AmpD n=1 Tax=Pokkaliibacter sp. CJK22405 TaxID=3384615 RepID=UPI0039851C88